MSQNKSSKSKLSIAATATLVGIASQANAIIECQTVNVTVGTDDDVSTQPGSLREAIETINAAGDCGDFHTITFTGAPSTIELDARIYIEENTYLQGPGATALTIQPEASPSGVGSYAPHFHHDSADLKVSDMTLTGFDRTPLIGDDSGNLMVSEVTISGNDVNNSGGGGAIQQSGSGSLTVSKSLLTGNKSLRNGGAIYSYGNTVISDSAITGNESDTSGGGVAIYANSGESVSITNTSIDGNTTFRQGGGLSFYGDNSGLEIKNSSITNNSATSTSDGGGLYLYDDNSAGILIENSTISNNSTLGNGGAIFAYVNGGSFDINHSTIVENSANYGGGFDAYLANNVSLDHTVLANNSAISDGENLYGTISIAENSFIGSSAGGTVTTNTDSTVDGDDSALGLKTLAENSEIGLTHKLEADSPLVDAGTATSTLTEDQLGNARVFGDATDIGAVEFQGEEEEFEEEQEDKGNSKEAVSSKKSSGLMNPLLLVIFSGLAIFRRWFINLETILIKLLKAS